MIQQILVIGFGSIGKRHVTNIQEFGKYKISVVSRKPLPAVDVQTFQVFDSIGAAYAAHTFDAVFICTPTAQHMKDLADVWNYGARKIYIEKPVSNNFTDVDVFCEKINTEKCNVIVGYDLHFDPGFMKVKELVEQGIIGKILSANAIVGQYLPDWRPNEDYKKSMSALVEKGGGVLLDLVHEIDYLYCLLGMPLMITAQEINSGCLEIATEELAEILVKFQNGALATIHLDYLQPALVRNCRLTGTEGSIFWNQATAEVNWIGFDKKEWSFNYASYTRNDRFKEIIQSFLEDKKDSRLTSFKEALVSLKIILAAKKAAAENSYIHFAKTIFA